MNGTFADSLRPLIAASAQMLNWQPSQFWQATPAEFWAALACPQDDYATPMTRSALEELMEHDTNG